jgi:hypothetical protein
VVSAISFLLWGCGFIPFRVLMGSQVSW